MKASTTLHFSILLPLLPLCLFTEPRLSKPTTHIKTPIKNQTHALTRMLQTYRSRAFHIWQQYDINFPALFTWKY